MKTEEGQAELTAISSLSDLLKVPNGQNYIKGLYSFFLLNR